MRKIWIAAIMACAAVPAIAHDFWIQPRQFALSKPGSVSVLMFVGHGPARDRWGVGADRVVLFNTIGPDGIVDRKEDLTFGLPQADAVVPFERPGSYVVLLQSTPTTSQLPALRFNDYVTEEGITPITAERKRRGAARSDGRELYSRRAKAILQVGPVDAASIARVTKPINLLLEIVPGRHPQALGKDRAMPVQVLFKGKPLAGALVKITNLADDAKPVATHRTGADGRTAFTIPGPGVWQLNVIWATLLKNDPRADFETTFSSLTFATS